MEFSRAFELTCGDYQAQLSLEANRNTGTECMALGMVAGRWCGWDMHVRRRLMESATRRDGYLGIA